MMRALVTLLLVMAGTLQSVACDYPSGPFLQTLSRWKETCHHPLCGTILPTDPARLFRTNSSCDGDPYMALRRDGGGLLDLGGFVLLGEVHDNADHHALRAAWIREPLDRIGRNPSVRRPALVMEHIRADQKRALALFYDFSRHGRHLDTPAEFFRQLKWDEFGWPDKQHFTPLLAMALGARLTILPGDPPRETVRAVARAGMATLGEAEVRKLKLDTPLAPALQDALLDELEASHCGLVPRAHFATMADAQRYRDAHLARALVDAARTPNAAILLAGNGHVRTDRGVPHYLRKMAPNRKIIAVMLLEVEEGKINPANYIPRDPDGRPAADYIIFTPRPSREDPCIAMRAQFKPKQ